MLYAAILSIYECGTMDESGDFPGWDEPEDFDWDDEDWDEEQIDSTRELFGLVAPDGSRPDYGALPLLAGELLPAGALDDVEPDHEDTTGDGQRRRADVAQLSPCGPGAVARAEDGRGRLPAAESSTPSLGSPTIWRGRRTIPAHDATCPASPLSSSTLGLRRTPLGSIAMTRTGRSRAIGTRCACYAALGTRPPPGASCARLPSGTTAAGEMTSCWRRRQ